MARTSSAKPRTGATLRSADVPDETVLQVARAVSEIVGVRQSLEEGMARARTNDERQNLTEEAESAAMRAIGDQGLTVAKYDEVITAAKSDPELEERVLTACRLV
jgi:hypothetical protein